MQLQDVLESIFNFMGSEIGISISGSIAISIFIYLCYIFFFRTRLVIKVLTEVGEGFQVVKKKNVPLNKTEYKYKKNSYVLDKEKAVRLNSREQEIFFKENETTALSFKPSDIVRDSRIMQNVLEARIMERVLHSHKEQMLFYLVIGLIIGMLLLGSFAIYEITSLQEELIKLAGEPRY